MWSGSPALHRWHIALADLCWHTEECYPCTRSLGQTSGRCQNGESLDRAEQAAYADWVSEQYAGKAVKP